jgi:hypothetical protein
MRMVDSTNSDVSTNASLLTGFKNDNSILVDRDEEQGCLLLGDGNIDEPSPLPDNSRRNTGTSAITYSCNIDLGGRS